MTGPKLPAVRLSSTSDEGEHLVQDAVVLDLPPFNKFSINYPSQAEQGRPIPTPPSSDRPALSSSDSGETDTSGDESNHELEASDSFNTNRSPTIPRLRPAVHGSGSSPHHPRFNRAFSLPLPSQLGYLQHPLKSSVFGEMAPRPPGSDPPSTEVSQFRQLSLELADSVQMVIQTMLQVSPSQVLDPAKEQFSACALAVPTPSMSAMLTAMKNLNYISVNVNTFCGGPMEGDEDDVPPLFSSKRYNDFDIGELLQSTGDALSGAAAHTGVDLVIYHGDVGLKHVWVKGDESGISYMLSHVIRQILNTAQRTDTLELGLFVHHQSPRRQEMSTIVETDEDDPFKDSTDGPLQCVVEMYHKFGPTDFPNNHLDTRVQPDLTTLLLRRLLRKVGATLTQDSSPSENGRSCRVYFALEAGSSPVDTPYTVKASGDSMSVEPSLEQLTVFMESLKGKKVNLYASSKGSFAHHLTSYLTAWGMDVSHISAEGGVDSQPETLPPSPTTGLRTDGYIPSGVPPKSEPRQPKVQPPSFIFIDDDVSVLRERLQVLRPENGYPISLSLRKRPSLAPHHRPRSSPQVARLGSSSAVILHFTSLSNFKLAKDVVQSILATAFSSPQPLPEVMIIPKPAGPRRFLTALYNAVTKPVFDTFFSPIATTPGSPSVLGNGGSFYHNVNTSNVSPKQPVAHRPTGSRSNSDRSSKSANFEGGSHGHTTSPLAIPDPVEYFSEAAVKLGASPSSGLVIQSPDGQPAGIFFHPKARGSSRTPIMERDRGHLTVTSNPRKSISDEKPPPVTFASLHESRNNNQAGPSTSLRTGTGLRSKPSSPRVPPPSPHPSLDGVTSSPVSDGQTILSTQAQTRSGLELPLASRKASGGSSSPRLDLSGNDLATRKTATPARRDSGNPLSPSTSTTTKKAKSPADGNIVPPISVLIVDDNPINRTILSTFMKKKKIKFDVASNGEEAVEKWKSGEFHLILMDIQMPVMNGIAATSEIRRIEKLNASAGYPPSTPCTEGGPPTPSDISSGTKSTASPYRSSVIIVALTASSLQSDRIAALAAGCNDFLTKPVSLQWLNNKLIEWGSIKALQMWADLAPSVGMPEARNIAERLHVPKERGISPSTSARAPQGLEERPPLLRPARQLSSSSLASTSRVNEPTPVTANGGTSQLDGAAEKDRSRTSTGLNDENTSHPSPSASIDPERVNGVDTLDSPRPVVFNLATGDVTGNADQPPPRQHTTPPSSLPEGGFTVVGDGHDGR
ncbi:hypothetical protein E1B28_003977 [Marasmius oreades]|uniref:Response regulatory domain-containing protein n=1 Tax=Marasmius oreades TaxID=181124 RepID=A0A9P8ACM7_9AGAR|nr:uncharacterized protein E1B28_003977 [Marasmius oreades]KAG7096555.1 hypothetical protein E1B28_003977 [Marasmius oreades]